MLVLLEKEYEEAEDSHLQESSGEHGLSNYQRLLLCGQEDVDPVQAGAPGATTLPGTGSNPQPPPQCKGRCNSSPPSKSLASQEQPPHPRPALQVLRVEALVVLA
ncbi:hypothetical protein AV530_002098 [Patagioenas fasciata monilis]|uniref:Uncharacterized protein n=1 Tax=Patagioenas fasciata monilis TaxID=372326 RepID=A0A1V4J6P2_PATFA|nr:hypothetical protein AV530_002098 [Patagioenas fasciata monilis]